MFKTYRSQQKSDSPSRVGLTSGQSEPDAHSIVKAMDRSQAVIRFNPAGEVLAANANFLNVMGYSLDEIRGKHHRMFVDSAYAASAEYADFWTKLRNGEFISSEFKRIRKGGSEVWIQASYNPIFDDSGRVREVIKFATDITDQKAASFDYRGQLEAIHRVQAVIEFDLSGHVISANENFLQLMGYRLEEIVGKHHSMFVSVGEEKTEAYLALWEGLRAGRPSTHIYKRIGKTGNVVWIQASYNPIFDWNQKPYKVVKFASDLTAFIQQTETTQVTAQSVAAAAEEMSCSIAEISRNMQMSREAAEKILGVSQSSGEQTSQLVASMKSMHSIVGLIRDIAARVNMLSLNATIEAARAGEAGKGFAVVASEVKNLSDQTAKATQQIGQEIGSIQKFSGSVAESVRDTMDGATQMSGYVSSVATAIEQQSMATRQISEHCSSLVTAVQTILRHTQQGA